ncbi:MAG TPA: septal ring lytic transglycosylase RlpA family protein [Xanthobacteraceae bacterium]|nr:septal ring lytic transglycosylase RlpA family protein [Xanthobacteraceae bacterium]
MRISIFGAAVAAAITFSVPVLVSAEPVSRGQASFYSYDQPTASGERFNPGALTAAHRTLPFGTKVRVTDVKSRKSVVVRINDRGPFIKGRIIDVSRAAAQQLGMIGRGVAQVEMHVVN